MAPFYLAGQLLKIPVWLTERLWLSLLVAVGFAGLVKLAEAVRIGTDRSRIVAGLAFALWPTYDRDRLDIGQASCRPAAPWAVLPLVASPNGRPACFDWQRPLRLRGCFDRKRCRVGRWSGGRRVRVAVLCMGGVNATSTLARPLILPALLSLPAGAR
jgi:arabinofuranan 3-O-arabinosyltransferase